MHFVDLDTAKASAEPCLVLLKGAPSPWSQAAKAIFELKRLPAVAVWKTPGDPAVSAWTGAPNAPVVMLADEPPRSHWADILAFAERLAPTPALVPETPAERVLAFGLCNEVMGQQGLVWNMRLSLIELSIRSAGTRGYAMPIATYLGARYGYTPDCGAAAAARVSQILQQLETQLTIGRAAGGPYYFGSKLSALDVYSAAAMDTLAPLPHAQCPMHPKTRAALEARRDAAADSVPASLLQHRDMMHAVHMPLPILC
jgi:glutathione S-transferase